MGLFPLFRVVEWVRLCCHNADLGEMVRGVGYNVTTYSMRLFSKLFEIID